MEDSEFHLQAYDAPFEGAAASMEAPAVQARPPTSDGAALRGTAAARVAEEAGDGAAADKVEKDVAAEQAVAVAAQPSAAALGGAATVQAAAYDSSAGTAVDDDAPVKPDAAATCLLNAANCSDPAAMDTTVAVAGDTTEAGDTAASVATGISKLVKVTTSAGAGSSPSNGASTRDDADSRNRQKETTEPPTDKMKKLYAGAYRAAEQLQQYSELEFDVDAAARRRDERGPLVAAAAQQAREAARVVELCLNRANVFDAGTERLHLTLSLADIGDARTTALREAIALADRLQLWLAVLSKLLATAAEKVWDARDAGASGGKRRVKAAVGEADAVVEAVDEHPESAARSQMLVAAKALSDADLARATKVVTRTSTSSQTAWIVRPRMHGAATVLPVSCDSETTVAWCAAEAVLLVDRRSFGRPRADSARWTTWVLSDPSSAVSGGLNFQVVYSDTGKEPPRFTDADTEKLLVHAKANTSDVNEDAGRFLNIVKAARDRGRLRITAGPHFNGHPLHITVSLGVGNQWHIYVRYNEGGAVTDTNKHVPWNGKLVVIDAANGGITDAKGLSPTDSVLAPLFDELAALPDKSDDTGGVAVSTKSRAAGETTGGAASGGAGAVAVAPAGTPLLEFAACRLIGDNASTVSSLAEVRGSDESSQPRASSKLRPALQRGGVSGTAAAATPSAVAAATAAVVAAPASSDYSQMRERRTWTSSAVGNLSPAADRKWLRRMTTASPDLASADAFPPLAASPRLVSPVAGTAAPKTPAATYAAVAVTAAAGAAAPAQPRSVALPAPASVGVGDGTATISAPLAAAMQAMQRLVQAMQELPTGCGAVVSRGLTEIFSALRTHEAHGKAVFIPMVPLSGRRHVVVSFTPASHAGAASTALPIQLLMLLVAEFFVDAALAHDTGDWYTVNTGRGELTLVVEARPSVEEVLASAGYD